MEKIIKFNLYIDHQDGEFKNLLLNNKINNLENFFFFLYIWKK